MTKQTEINKKLILFQQKVEAIKKDGKNTFFKKPNGAASTYATLNKILEEVKPILSELGLIITQPIKDDSVFTVITDSNSGEFIDSSIKISTGLNAQSTGSAITYFRRYTLTSLLSLETEEDDDGNNASKPPTTPPTEDDKRPWLSEKQFQDALLRCEDADFLAKLFKAFKMKKEYREQLNKKAEL